MQTSWQLIDQCVGIPCSPLISSGSVYVWRDGCNKKVDRNQHTSCVPSEFLCTEFFSINTINCPSLSGLGAKPCCLLLFVSFPPSSLETNWRTLHLSYYPQLVPEHDLGHRYEEGRVFSHGSLHLDWKVRPCSSRVHIPAPRRIIDWGSSEGLFFPIT